MTLNQLSHFGGDTVKYVKPLSKKPPDYGRTSYTLLLFASSIPPSLVTEELITYPLLLSLPLVTEGQVTFLLLLQHPLVTEGQVTETILTFLGQIWPHTLV